MIYLNHKRLEYVLFCEHDIPLSSPFMILFTNIHKLKLIQFFKDLQILLSLYSSLVFMSVIYLFFQGQFFSGSAYRIYLLGNPIIWWSNLIFLLLFLIVLFITAIKEQRRGPSTESIKNGNFYMKTFHYPVPI